MFPVIYSFHAESRAEHSLKTIFWVREGVITFKEFELHPGVALAAVGGWATPRDKLAWSPPLLPVPPPGTAQIPWSH